VERRAREVSEREHREQFEEFTLLQSRVSELCHAIIDTPRAMHHLSEGMWLVALRHTEMARVLATLWAAVSTVAESVLGCSPSDTFYVEVLTELAADFQKIEDQRSWIKRHAMRIYDLLLGPPSGRSRLAVRLDEAVEQLRVELVARREAGA
jgi:hypothetical protein